MAFNDNFDLIGLSEYSPLAVDEAAESLRLMREEGGSPNPGSFQDLRRLPLFYDNIFEKRHIDEKHRDEGGPKFVRTIRVQMCRDMQLPKRGNKISGVFLNSQMTVFDVVETVPKSPYGRLNRSVTITLG